LDIRIKESLDKQKLAVLATQDNGFPYTNLVSFAATVDCLSLLFVTPRNTRKYRNLIDHPQVSLLIDNRANDESDLRVAVAITVIGQAEEIAVNQQGLKERYLIKHPALVDFINNPENALFQVKVFDFVIAGFSQTTLIRIGNG
jgi:uncharacterized pyridoxamine 5'-phosphate oxidase family protein